MIQHEYAEYDMQQKGRICRLLYAMEGQNMQNMICNRRAEYAEYDLQ